MLKTTTVIILGALALAGCSNLSAREDRALKGGAIGAAGGAVIGAVTGGSPLVGGLVGGAGGAALGALTAPESRPRSR